MITTASSGGTRRYPPPPPHCVSYLLPVQCLPFPVPVVASSTGDAAVCSLSPVEWFCRFLSMLHRSPSAEAGSGVRGQGSFKVILVFVLVQLQVTVGIRDLKEVPFL